jgi:4-hydroxy-tetrahydrodipicolinate reductase
MKAGKFGHVGLSESAALVAHALGWEYAAVKEETRLLVAEQAIQNKSLAVPKGRVKGMAQTATAKVLDHLRVQLDLEMSADAKDARDEIEIVGVPPLRVVIPGGVAGDFATPAILVNSLPRVLSAPRGVVTVLDVLWPKLVR